MSNRIAGTGIRSTVVAIAKEQGGLKAVELHKHGRGFEVAWTKSVSEGWDWSGFARECGLSVDTAREAAGDHRKKSVVGFDSMGVVFYSLKIPTVGAEEVASVVRLQAESRMPLPAEKMELAWRGGQSFNGQMAVTLAAARKDTLHRFANAVMSFKPQQIILDCEALVAAWRTFFSSGETQEKVVLLSAERHNTRVCLVDGGLLANAAVLDMGEANFTDGDDVADLTERNERFVQDLRSVLGLFGFTEGSIPQIQVMSDGRESLDSMVGLLREARLRAEAVLPVAGSLSHGAELEGADLYEYRVAIGLGVMGLDDRSERLDIFGAIYSPSRKQKKTKWYHSMKLAISLAAVMAVLLVTASYVVDVAKPEAINKRLSENLSESDMQLLVERRSALKAVAAERPDMLELISLVNSSAKGGIKLNGVHFKKDQRTKVSGQADNTDRLYEFEETLLGKKDIRDVKRDNASKSPKGGKIEFEVSFNYKTFGKKTGR